MSCPVREDSGQALTSRGCAVQIVTVGLGDKAWAQTSISPATGPPLEPVPPPGLLWASPSVPPALLPAGPILFTFSGKLLLSPFPLNLILISLRGGEEAEKGRGLEEG